MEEDKKKKKSKKKKSKHNKTTEDVTVNNGETSPPEQNHVVVPEKNQCVQIWGLAENDKSGSSEPDSKLEKDLTDEAKNATLEEVVRQFEAEKQSWLQREAQLEEQIKQVVSEKRSWLLKEATIAEEIKHLEREKDSWITKEIFAKETIARLSEVNQRLETQVNELEGFRNGLLEERQKLVESMSVLESRIQQLEREALPPASSTEELMKHVPEDESLNIQIETASVLVAKLIAENAELVEKVNEPYVELNGQGRFVGDSFATRVDSSAAETLLAGASIIVTADTPSMVNVNMLTAEDEKISVDDADQAEDSNILTEIQEEGEPEAYYIDKVGKNVTSMLKGDIPVVDMQEEVSLIDAPLIGAPFRLISFVAKYISGADLVD